MAGFIGKLLEGCEGRRARLSLLSGVIFIFIINVYLLFFFAYYAYSNGYFTSPFKDLLEAFCFGGIVLAFWLMHVRIKFFGTHNNLIEISSAFLLLILVVSGPAAAFFSYALGTLFFDFKLCNKFSGRKILVSNLLNVCSYGAAFWAAARFLVPFELSRPYLLLGKFAIIVGTQTAVIIILGSLYSSTIDNKKLWPILRNNIFTPRRLLEALSIALFPGLAFLALLLWERTSLWYYRILSPLFLLSFSLLFRQGLKDYTWLLDASYERLAFLIDVLDMRDPYTARHSKKDALYSAVLGRQEGLDENRLETLERETMLHDIGKVHIPDDVLLKEGKLSKEDWEVMRQHTQLAGKHFLDLIPEGFPVKEWIKVGQNHHEKADGTGYPRGLKGEEIPEDAAIIMLADVFDGMTSGRRYREGKKGFTPEQAFQFLFNHASWSLPKHLEALKAAKGKFLEIYEADPAHHVYMEPTVRIPDNPRYAEAAWARVQKEVAGRPKDLRQVEGENFFRRSVYSPRSVLYACGLTLLPLLIGALLYFFLDASSLKLPFLFAGLFWTMEEWKLRDPGQLPTWGGDIAFLAALFLFGGITALALVSGVMVLRLLLYSILKPEELRFIFTRTAFLVVMAEAFLRLHVGRLSSTGGTLRAAAWILIYAAAQGLFLNTEAMLRGRSRRVFFRMGPFRKGPVQRFLAQTAVVFPLVGFTLISFASSSTSPFLLSLACLFSILFLLFFIYRLRSAVLVASYRTDQASAWLLSLKLQYIQWKLPVTPVLLRGFLRLESLMACEISFALEDAKILLADKEGLPASHRLNGSRVRYTQWRLINTANLARIIAEEMRLNPYEIERIMLAVYHHEDGNAAIPDRVFNTRGRLAPEDLRHVRTHPEKSVEALRGKKSILYEDCLDLVLYHHERPDGKGYPCGLKGNEIPVGAQVIAAAGAIDSMISPRPDRDLLSLEEALQVLNANSGTQFSPAVVKATLKAYQKGRIRIKVANDLPAGR